MINEHVRKMQVALAAAGEYQGSIDGIPGPKTLAAVEALAGINKPVSDKLDAKSIAKLNGVNDDLRRVIMLAADKCSVPFVVTEGLRTESRQAELVKAGASQTMKSRHLTGNAVDVAPKVNGKVSWDINDFYPVVVAVRAAAEELGIKVTWGGCWEVLNGSSAPPKDMVKAYASKKRKAGKRAFIDGPHFELL